MFFAQHFGQEHDRKIKCANGEKRLPF